MMDQIASRGKCFQGHIQRFYRTGHLQGILQGPTDNLTGVCICEQTQIIESPFDIADISDISYI